MLMSASVFARKNLTAMMEESGMLISAGAYATPS
jgi:hypothetical protein